MGLKFPKFKTAKPKTTTKAMKPEEVEGRGVKVPSEDMRTAADNIENQDAGEEVKYPEHKKIENESTRDMTARVVKDNTLAVLAHGIGKKVPLLGVAIIMNDIKDRMDRGDYSGAVMEAASGAVSQFPVFGTIAGLAIDVMIRSRDEKAFTEEEARRQQEIDPHEHFRKERLLVMDPETARKIGLDARSQAHELSQEQPAQTAGRPMAILETPTLTAKATREAMQAHQIDPKIKAERENAINNIFGRTKEQGNEGHPDLAGPNRGMTDGNEPSPGQSQHEREGQDYSRGPKVG